MDHEWAEKVNRILYIVKEGYTTVREAVDTVCFALQLCFCTDHTLQAIRECAWNSIVLIRAVTDIETD